MSVQASVADPATKIASRCWSRGGRSLSLSRLGFGGAPLGNMHRALSDVEVEATLDAAWDSGMRYFDTAPLYGHGLSEQRLGRMLRDRPRDEFVLSTKVGRLLEDCAVGEEASGIYVDTPPRRVMFDYSYDGVMRSFEASLTRLGLDRVDVLFVHDIDALTHGDREAADKRAAELLDQGGWRALEELRANGVVRAIGAGVNETAACEMLLDHADPDLFLLAGRYTLLDQSAAITLLPRCLDRGVGIVLGGPYNSGILASGAVAGATYDYAPASDAILDRVRRLEEICARHGVPLVRAALHFPLAHPVVLSVIPGSQTKEQVACNLDIFLRPPPEALWDDLARQGLVANW